MESYLREATEDYTVWGDPIFGLMFDYGLDWREAKTDICYSTYQRDNI